MNCKFIPSRISLKCESHINLGQLESIYSLNFRKIKVYIRFLQQSGDFTDEDLSVYRMALNHLLAWLDGILLCNANMKSLRFSIYLEQIIISNCENEEKSCIIKLCQDFFYWAKSMYGSEFTNFSILWIFSLAYSKI